MADNDQACVIIKRSLLLILWHCMRYNVVRGKADNDQEDPCASTSKDEHTPGFTYRLPTEAEWEYAARAGTEGLRPMPVDQLPDHAWYIENSGDKVQPVATRKANTWDLHDMFGNVWEWTADWYAPDYYANAPDISPQGPADGNKKLRRGGSYHCPMHLVRPGYRSADAPTQAYSVVGFRLVAEPGH